MKKLMSVLLFLTMAVTLSFPCLAETDADAENEVPAAESGDSYEYEEVFAEWNEDAPALQELVDYVEIVTDEVSDDYIPPEDRIAVFDMDGTLYGELFPTYLEYYMMAWRILEDPSFQPDEEMLEVAREIRDSVDTRDGIVSHSFASDMPARHAVQAARAYAGMTIDEFSDFVTEILLRDVDGFEGMTYGEAFYLPMIEVVEYLQDNDFKVFVVSGSDRFICRTLIEGYMDVSAENIIGMDVAMIASGQNGTDGLDYVFDPENDKLIRSDQLLIKNIKMNKVSQIARDIGRQPVLSFGNTSGDVSMHNYTISNNPYKSEAFMLIADDEERDYGNYEKAQSLRQQWEESGYHVISMKDDFRTIYGDDVVKTGSFRWADELADSREENRRGSGPIVLKADSKPDGNAEIPETEAPEETAAVPELTAEDSYAEIPETEASEENTEAPEAEIPEINAEASEAEVPEINAEAPETEVPDVNAEYPDMDIFAAGAEYPYDNAYASGSGQPRHASLAPEMGDNSDDLFASGSGYANDVIQPAGTRKPDHASYASGSGQPRHASFAPEKGTLSDAAFAPEEAPAYHALPAPAGGDPSDAAFAPTEESPHHASLGLTEENPHHAAFAPTEKTPHHAAFAPETENSFDGACDPGMECPAEENTDPEDIQYVMYLGTNDKDTNEPVCTPEEAKEKTKAILTDHFGGYTIQEAEGGWIDEDGTLYQEYTLVIYLSDTSPDAVHEAADELIREFDQSSVLIQANRTQTEFYSG